MPVEAEFSVSGFIDSLFVSSTGLIYDDVREGASRCKLDSHDFGFTVLCEVNVEDVSFCFAGCMLGTMTVGMGTEIVTGAEVGVMVNVV